VRSIEAHLVLRLDRGSDDGRDTKTCERCR
jgi:hypothetical protein